MKEKPNSLIRTSRILIPSSPWVTIEHVEDITFLGSTIRNSESDIRVRKEKAWGAYHTLKKLWNSKLRKSIKIRVFAALVESVLLYGSETWTMTKRLEKMVDGCYTRMLRMALNINQYRDHVSNHEGSDSQVMLINIRS